MKKKSLEFRYEFNTNGCPNVSAEDAAYLTVESGEASDGDGNVLHPTIEIAGNRSGLIALARWLVALADEESKLDHQHFDNEVGFGFYQSKDETQLIVTRLGK